MIFNGVNNMRCPVCDSNLPEGAIRCEVCGTDVGKYTYSNNSQQRNKTIYENNSYNREQVYSGGAPASNTTNIIIGVMIGVILVLVLAIAALVVADSEIFSSKKTTKNSQQQQSTSQSDVVETFTPQTPRPKKIVSSYKAVKSNATWQQAANNAAGQNSHLVYIDSYDEFKTVCDIAYNNNIKIFWVGARRNSGSSWESTPWLNGMPMNFTQWYKNEPTYISENGYEECYLMVFRVNGVWYFNDAVNDVSNVYSGRMGYVIETETEVEG